MLYRNSFGRNKFFCDIITVKPADTGFFLAAKKWHSEHHLPADH